MQPQLIPFTEPTPVGKGFVRLVDVMGDDESIVRTARVSTGKSRSRHDFKDAVLVDPPGEPSYKRCRTCGEAVEHLPGLHGWEPIDPGARCVEADRRLIRYMMRNAHTSPFEFAKIILHVRLPIFVARQWIRHRTGTFSEYSGRYSQMIDEVHAVEAGEWRAQGTANRQGSAGFVTNYPSMSSEWVKNGGMDSRWGCAVPGRKGGFQGPDSVNTAGEYLSFRQAELHNHAREVYEERLAFGVAKEQARVDVPVGNFTEWYWTTDLHNLIGFLRLRLDAHAQKEIRDFAEAIAPIVAAWVPLCWAAAKDWRVDAVTVSGPQLRALQRVLADYAARAEPEDDVDPWKDLRLQLSDQNASEVGDFIAKLKGAS